MIMAREEVGKGEGGRAYDPLKSFEIILGGAGCAFPKSTRAIPAPLTAFRRCVNGGEGRWGFTE